ncbi:MAG: branched-chain amino acid ABC transporter permease [Spirochaetaceae bacterium]
MSGETLTTRTAGRSRSRFILVVFGVLLVFPLLQIATGRFNYVLHMMMFIMLYIAMASSWNIIGGYTGYTSLGHNVFYAVGAYFSGLVMTYLEVSPFITFPLAGVAALLVGLLVGLIALRTRGPAFIIATIAMVMLTLHIIDQWKFAGGANGLSLPFIPLDPRVAKLPFYYAILLVATGAVVMSYRIRHSKFGLGLRAISQDEIKAEVAGLPTNRYKIAAFALSGLFVGMCGALWGYYLTYLRPDMFLTIAIASNMVLMSIIGGKGTVAGPVVGALIIVMVNEFFVSSLGSTALNIVFTGTVLILTLVFFPRGVVGTLKEHNRLPGFLDWE